MFRTRNGQIRAACVPLRVPSVARNDGDVPTGILGTASPDAAVVSPGIVTSRVAICGTPLASTGIR